MTTQAETGGSVAPVMFSQEAEIKARAWGCSYLVRMHGEDWGVAVTPGELPPGIRDLFQTLEGDTVKQLEAA